MTCYYPNCRSQALYTPVVELPTIRTLGLIRPTLSNIVNDLNALRTAGFKREEIIAQYERQVAQYRQDLSTLAQTDKPTYMILREVCQKHCNDYNFLDWFKESEWEYVREAARYHGYSLPEIRLLRVQFKPVGWTPGNTHIEIER